MSDTPEIEVNWDIFNEKYLSAHSKFRRHNYIYGGSSSSKSHSMQQYAILWALQGEACIFVRATKASIRSSNFADIKSIMADMGVEHLFSVNETRMEFKSLVSVGCIQLAGADKDASAAKGIKPCNGQGAFTKLIFDECDQIPRNAVIQLNLRLRGLVKGGFKTQSFYVFNPVLIQHWLFQLEILKYGFDPYNDWELVTDEVFILRCTYKDNRFLKPEEIEYLESLAKISEYYAQVYLRAEPGVLGDRVFENVRIVDRTEIPKTGKFEWCAGLDFGWNDPTAFTLMKVDHIQRVIYVIDGFSKSKLDHIGISNRVKAIYQRHGISHGLRIYGDSEDPRLISQINNEGLNAKPAKKPPGSVLSGLMVMNTYIIIVVKDLKDHVDAFSNYTWKQENGTSTDEPDHTWSHPCDAGRYGLEKILKGSKETNFGHRK